MAERIDQLLNAILKFRSDRDWEKFHTPRNLAISISLEAAELLEIFQWQVGEEPLTPEVKERASKEMADIFIYLLSISRSGYRSHRSCHKEIGRKVMRDIPSKNLEDHPGNIPNLHEIHTSVCGI